MAEKATNVSPSQDKSVMSWMNDIKMDDSPDIVPGTEPAPEPPTTPVEAPGGDKTPPAPEKPATSQPAAKTTPPVAAAKAEPEPEQMPRTADKWKKFIAARDEGYKKRETERDQLKAQYEAAQKEIATLKTAGPSVALDDLKKERDELSERLRIVDVQQHPKFKAHFEGKINAQIDMVKRIVPGEAGDKLAKVLRLPDSEYRTAQIETLTAELSQFNQTRLSNIVNSVDQIEAERESAVANERQNFERMQAQREAETKTTQQKLETEFDSLLTAAQKDHPAFQVRDGDEQWNQGVKDRLQHAKELLFGKPSADVVMKAAISAVALPAVLSSYQTALTENESLKAQVAELTAAQPKVDGAAPTKTGTQVPVKVRSGQNPMAAAEDWLKLVTQPPE